MELLNKSATFVGGMFNKAADLGRKACSVVAKTGHKLAAAAVVGGALFFGNPARAADADLTGSITTLSGAVTTAGTIVAGLVALGAGLAVYKKVKGYFSKS